MGHRLSRPPPPPPPSFNPVPPGLQKTKFLKKTKHGFYGAFCPIFCILLIRNTYWYHFLDIKVAKMQEEARRALLALCHADIH